VGAIAHDRAGYRTTWDVLVRRIVVDRLIETEVHPPGLDIVQRFEVEPIASGVRIRHEIAVDGWAAGFTRLTLKPFSSDRWRRRSSGSWSSLGNRADTTRPLAAEVHVP
jgi:hypothetical protein